MVPQNMISLYKACHSSQTYFDLIIVIKQDSSTIYYTLQNKLRLNRLSLLHILTIFKIKVLPGRAVGFIQYSHYPQDF